MNEKFYEQVPKTKLMRRCPVIIRCDGRSFHTYTRGFARSFDDILIGAMQNTMKYLCENIQGCVLGYTQAEIAKEYGCSKANISLIKKKILRHMLKLEK